MVEVSVFCLWANSTAGTWLFVALSWSVNIVYSVRSLSYPWERDRLFGSF